MCVCLGGEGGGASRAANTVLGDKWPGPSLVLLQMLVLAVIMVLVQILILRLRLPRAALSKRARLRALVHGPLAPALQIQYLNTSLHTRISNAPILDHVSKQDRNICGLKDLPVRQTEYSDTSALEYWNGLRQK